MESNLIANQGRLIPQLKFQVVLSIEDEKAVLYSVNILINAKIIKKIKNVNTALSFEIMNAENIALDYIESCIAKEMEGIKKNKKMKVGEEAKISAATDLMKTFNL